MHSNDIFLQCPLTPIVLSGQCTHNRRVNIHTDEYDSFMTPCETGLNLSTFYYEADWIGAKNRNQVTFNLQRKHSTKASFCPLSEILLFTSRYKLYAAQKYQIQRQYRSITLSLLKIIGLIYMAIQTVTSGFTWWGVHHLKYLMNCCYFLRAYLLKASHCPRSFLAGYLLMMK